MPQPAATTAAPVVAAVPVSSVAAQAPTPATLPDPAQLDSGADISAFMAKGVDDLLRRKALKTLFSDPHFNVMDRMDVYIDDYSIADPLPPDWLDKLEQVTHLGDKAGRDRAEAERQAALDAQSDSDEGAAAASEPSEAVAEPSGAPTGEPLVADGEPGPDAATSHPSASAKPQPQA